jgi:hypothetical protein
MEKTVKMLENIGFRVTGRDPNGERMQKIEATCVVKGQTLTVEFIRPKKKQDGDFLPASIYRESKLVWNFQSEEFSGLARFVKVGLRTGEKVSDEYVIAFLKDQGKLLSRILPVADLVGVVEVTLKSTGKKRQVGGKNKKDLLKLKISCARKLHVDCVFTDDEKALSAELREAEEKAKEEKRLAIKAEKEEKKTRILKRPVMKVFRPDGSFVFGTPVVGEEWMCLDNGKKVVRVKSYDDSTNTAGDLIEAFEVNKRTKPATSSNVITPIYLEKPVAETAEANIEALSVVKVNIGSCEMEVLHFASGSLKALRKAGVNSGTVVAIGKPDKESRLKVVSLDGDKIEDLGAFKYEEVE